VIGVEEVASRLGVAGQDEFYSALNELHLQGRLILKEGFAGLPDLEDKISIKAAKIATSTRLINSRLGCIKRLGRIPIIKFVGVSGSLAAGNPVSDRNNKLDLDLFLITRSQCLWPYILLRNLRDFFPRSQREPALCGNYVMDESNLIIANRNFYTATEIRNLIPISGLDLHRKFLQVNSWVDYYYPGYSGASVTIDVAPSRNLVGKFFYVLYTLLRSIKVASIDPLRKFSFKSDPHRGIGLNMLTPRYGGYQALVQKKFTRLAEIWFPDLLGAELIGKLFPDELSAEIGKGDIDVAKVLGYDYSKYG